MCAPTWVIPVIPSLCPVPSLLHIRSGRMPMQTTESATLMGAVCSIVRRSLQSGSPASVSSACRTAGRGPSFRPFSPALCLRAPVTFLLNSGILH